MWINTNGIWFALPHLIPFYLTSCMFFFFIENERMKVEGKQVLIPFYLTSCMFFFIENERMKVEGKQVKN